MAKLYPNKIPTDVLNDPFRKSEIKIYKKLETLSNDFFVFYSVAFQLKGKYDFVSDGEIDFLIFHPLKGFLVIEVKGGKIEFNNGNQVWTSTNRFGEKNLIKNPFEQAKSNHYSLRTKLKQCKLTQTINYRTGYAVIFPDCNLANQNVGFSYDSSIFIENNQINSEDFESQITKLFEFWNPSSIGKPYEIKPVIDTFAFSWKFESPLLDYVENVDAQQLELTEQQFLLIDFLNKHKKAKICGCAGSGKTFIAAEKCRRLKQEGFNPVFLCWSRTLKNWLSLKLKSQDIPILTISEFLDNQEKETLKEFDSFIVDEGQDIRGDYWKRLAQLINDDTHLYIFYDDNQKIYFKHEQTIPLLKEFEPYHLSFNCRNTKSIHNLSLPFYKGATQPECLIRIDRKPEIISAKKGLEFTIQEILDKLHQNEKIPLSRITILTPRQGERKGPSYPPVKSLFRAPCIRIGSFDIVRDKSQVKSNKWVLCSTIQSYKGIENDIIILAELDNVINQDNISQLLYVGLTRCKSHLIILFEKEESLKKFESFVLPAISE